MQYTYPKVIGEKETIELMLDTQISICRYGDGEFKLIKGQPAKAQQMDPRLQAELMRVVVPTKDYIVGIPTLDPNGPKYAYWHRFMSQWGNHKRLAPNTVYYSAFISRPDSAPWIDNDEYWGRVRQLWTGRHVILVRGSHKALQVWMMQDARKVTEILGPTWHAYAQIDELQHKIVSACQESDSVVLLALGPTATVLAARLARHGIRALDLGHLGMFMRRYMKGVTGEA